MLENGECDNLLSKAVLRLHVYDVGRCEKVLIVTCSLRRAMYRISQSLQKLNIIKFGIHMFYKLESYL